LQHPILLPEVADLLDPQLIIDQQGRMIVPPGLRDYAQLGAEVFFFGVFDRVELWSKQVWERRDVSFGSTGS